MGGELLDHAAVAFAQHVQLAGQWAGGVRGNVFEHVVKLIRGVGVHLSGEGRPGEAARQARAALCHGYALLEQRVDRPWA